MKSQKKTPQVANPQIPGIPDTVGLQTLKEQAISLMAESLGEEGEHSKLSAEADQLRSRLAELCQRCYKARDSAAVKRLRAGKAFREVREVLKPSKGGWTAWLLEIKESHGWKETTVREAIELFELAGDESRVRGLGITAALKALRTRREQQELMATVREEGGLPTAASRILEAERKDGGTEVEGDDDSAEAEARLSEARARLSEEFGSGWDPEAFDPQEVTALAAMFASGPSAGLSRLRSAWEAASGEDREAFLLWVKGVGGRRRPPSPSCTPTAAPSAGRRST